MNLRDQGQCAHTHPDGSRCEQRRWIETHHIRPVSAILAKAFRGELVPQDPDDEPASVLLARIHAQRAASPKRTRARQAARALTSTLDGPPALPVRPHP